ncbi:RbsD/FucU family protein [Acidihalobacter ferrooxydans]|uniref:Ribose ABC transporter n=1 Tax=Acidihalobacter ferrooxydans TaxID=1765967 RepID=A0A1P8UCW2_9GAMM|nr:RbsD/FucU domain-containing protein [Acidihalobacter ferrooxydans]APZ41700.1 ribose ABC transporter [Acidihalobacter ferrooxydans]
MLKNLSRLHTPDLLHALASMGHGDEIVLVDANYPAASLAQRLVCLYGANLPEIVDACLQLMPLDGFADQPALRMEVVGTPAQIPDIQQECQALIDLHEGTGRFTLGGIERQAFYSRSREAYAIVATGEQRPYGCIILKKGVILPS